MLHLCDSTPSRRQLQDLILSCVRTVRDRPAAETRPLRELARRSLLIEVRLHDYWTQAVLQRRPLSEAQEAILDNAHNWTYEPQVEIQCVKCDEGPGVQFAFNREVALTELGKLATGRYWVGRNHRTQLFEDALEAMGAADAFLAGPGMALGALLQNEFRRRLQECAVGLEVA